MGKGRVSLKLLFLIVAIQKCRESGDGDRSDLKIDLKLFFILFAIFHASSSRAGGWGSIMNDYMLSS